MANPQSASKWWQFVTIAGRVESIRPSVQHKPPGLLSGTLESILPPDLSRKLGLGEAFISVLDVTLEVGGEDGTTTEHAQIPAVLRTGSITVNDDVSLGGYRNRDGVLIVQSGQNLVSGEPIQTSGTSLVPVSAQLPAAVTGPAAAHDIGAWDERARYGRIDTIDERRIPTRAPNDLESLLATFCWSFVLPLALTLAIIWLGLRLLPYVLPLIWQVVGPVLEPIISPWIGTVVLLIIISSVFGGGPALGSLGCLFGPIAKLLMLPVTIFRAVSGWVREIYVRRITANMSKDYPVYTIRLRRAGRTAERPARRDDNWEIPGSNIMRDDAAPDSIGQIRSGADLAGVDLRGVDLVIVNLAGFLAKGAIPKQGDYATFYGSVDPRTGVFNAVSGIRHPTGEVFAVWRPRWMR